MRRVLLTLAAAALIWGALVFATGGVDWRFAGVSLKSRTPDRALLIGLALFALQAALYRDAFARDSERLTAWLRRLLPIAAAVLAVGLATRAIAYGSFTAGASDPFGYVSQAYAWAHGTLPASAPLPIQVPWPSGDASLAPLGYRPGPKPHTMVPTYAPGLPLLMAAALVAGACGPYLVGSVAAAALVWFAFVLGRRIDGPWTGGLAALFAAASPIVLMQSLWPMSDIPAAALVAAAACAALGSHRRDALWCGVATAAALAVRPNLPVVPLVLFGGLLSGLQGRERWVRAALFAAPVAMAAVGIAALNTAWYGAPWKSGYGAAEELFLLSNVRPNLARYPVWLWNSQSPLVILAALPLVPPFNRSGLRRGVWLCAALFLTTLGSYLLYAPFEEWWYVRFLLPAMPALFVLLAMGLVSAGRRLPVQWGRIAVAALAVLILVATSRFSQALPPPEALKQSERRYADVGTYLNQALPGNAVVLSVQESGSVRFYGGRFTIRWDLIDRDWTSRAVAELERQGLHPYLVIEDFELPQFREWFGIPADAPLPWPLVGRMREHGGVSVLDLASRAEPQPPVALEPGRAPLCAGPAELVLRR